jgi:hypothetical protein
MKIEKKIEKSNCQEKPKRQIIGLVFSASNADLV